MRAKTFKQVMARKPRQFEQILDKVEELRLLNEVLVRYIDSDLAPHCQVANFRAGCLVIMANSAAWATRLRYTFPELLSRLRYEGRLYNLSSLHCIVRKEHFMPSAPKQAPLTISSENAQLFEDIAATETDPELAAVLQKLARNGRR